MNERTVMDGFSEAKVFVVDKLILRWSLQVVSYKGRQNFHL